MAKELTRVGVVGLELTREEVIELWCSVKCVMNKAQMREVNCDIIDKLDSIAFELSSLETDITNILESEE